MSISNPIKLPQWRAISLESKLTRQMLGSGLSSISRANYADGMGEYYSAFFGLSVGIERLCKLVLSFDHEQKTGKFLELKELRGFGHRIKKLIKAVDDVVEQRNVVLQYRGHEDPICLAIIQQLDAFADAGRDRYANFSTMLDGSNSASEPLLSWNQKVVNPILEKHFRGTRREQTAQINAREIQSLLGGHSHVEFTSEDGSALDTLEKASFRTAENLTAQKYGRFYSFLVIRYLAEVFYELTSTRGYETGGEMWFGHYEHFNTYTVGNEFGLNRKVWPLR